MAADSKFGTLGLDVGFVGRWSRLILGFLFVGPVAVQIANDLRTSGGDLSPYVPTVAYLAGIVAAYVAVYWVLGERLFARGFVWTNTAILVGPAAVVAWWNLTVGPVTGISLPAPFALAMAIYIGVSFLIQWRIKYGGCEVVSIPILILRRRYQTYCLPIVVIDAVEKQVVDRVHNRQVLASVEAEN